MNPNAKYLEYTACWSGGRLGTCSTREDALAKKPGCMMPKDLFWINSVYTGPMDATIELSDDYYDIYGKTLILKAGTYKASDIEKFLGPLLNRNMGRMIE